MGDTPALFPFRNQIVPPITDPDYAAALALRSHMESYDYIVSQPSVLTWETGQRFLELLKQPPKPLPGAGAMEE